jgi:hypothetical protein
VRVDQFDDGFEGYGFPALGFGRRPCLDGDKRNKQKQRAQLRVDPDHGLIVFDKG